MQRIVKICYVSMFLLLAGNAYGQTARTVTLMLNTATIPDTTRVDDMISVRGAVGADQMNLFSPATLADGSVISWGDDSTLRPTNVGGDYWQITFQIADTTDLTFKFFSPQAQSVGVDGWEADPNPMIPRGTRDTTLALHYFESQSEWRGVSGDRGDYDWRPFPSKEDSVGVWFRVVMLGMEAEADGYDPTLTSPAQNIGVRGDGLDIDGDEMGDGPVDWGTTNVLLERESTNENQVGYNIYSGVAYYSASLVGMEQAYKFVTDDMADGVGWEEGMQEANRSFTVPASDTTLQWVYYGSTPPTAVDPVTSNIVFGVDLSAFEEAGFFDRARGDTLWVFGSFNGWQDCQTQSPDLCLMEKEPGGTTFAAAVPVTAIPSVQHQYKYFLDFDDEEFMADFGVPPPSGWEEAYMTGINRRFVFGGTEQQTLPVAYFNDVTPANLMGDGASVELTFSVDMSSALTYDAQPFDPAGGDTVSIHLGDPIWAFTQGIDGTDHEIPLLDELQLEDADGDNVYEGTWVVSGPSYNIVTYRYMYGRDGTYVQESGSDTNAPGRNRVHFIPRNADGSYPATYGLPMHEINLDPGPLPYETDPLISSVEEVAGEVPEAFSLGSNYPNPFNPTTTFEYSLKRAEVVRVRVYDMLGRLVVTLVDGLQQPATYQVTFDASELASGVYMYTLETPTTKMSKRMLLVK